MTQATLFEFPTDAARLGSREERLARIKNALSDAVRDSGWTWIGPGGEFSFDQLRDGLIVAVEAWSRPDWDWLESLRRADPGRQTEIVVCDLDELFNGRRLDGILGRFRPRRSPAVVRVRRGSILATWERPPAEEVLETPDAPRDDLAAVCARTEDMQLPGEWGR